MITEWNYKRIFIAVLLAVIFIALPFYLLNEQPAQTPIKVAEDTKILAAEKPIKPTIKKVIEVVKPMVDTNNKLDISIKESKPEVTANVKTLIKVTNDKIVRALLTTGLNNKEPINSIKSALTATTEKAAGLYYFTEIVGMKGQALYHHWFKGDKVVYKRKINILGNRWRASTSKMIPFAKAGIWRVRLVDKQGIILNEIQFKVIQG